jgi:PII-like signaling protein
MCPIGPICSQPSAFPTCTPSITAWLYTQHLRPPEDSVLLRISAGDNHRYQHLPLFEAVVLKVREFGLAGATVLHGILGFGQSQRLHNASILRLSFDLPMILEIVHTRTNRSLPARTKKNDA